ncbi:MAG TPA: hypothetical protein VK426_10205 [Methanobacterium sp.]|nr:hypothetical protein [Methanobacterium sp.]
MEEKGKKLESPLSELKIPPEGLLKKELQDEIEVRIAYLVENLFHLDTELIAFVELVKNEIEANKESPDALIALYSYLDEMWSVVITNELRDVLLDTLCIVQEQKHELEEILEELEETVDKLVQEKE